MFAIPSERSGVWIQSRASHKDPRLSGANRLDAVVIARYTADSPTLEMRIDPLRETLRRQHRKICSSGGTSTAA